MANVVKEAKYIKSDYENNNNKFWYIFVYDDHSVTTEYGRVGKSPQSKTKQFNSDYQAEDFFNKKCKEKTRAGRNGEIAYRPINVVSSGTSVTSGKVVAQNSLESIAKKQIGSDCKATDDLIKMLVKVNAHNIVNNTTITYDKVSGLFETPCGIVTQTTIDDAKKVLAKIGDFVSDHDLGSRKYGSILNDYLMLIPQEVGRKLDPHTLYTSLDDVRKQNDILDSLQASLDTVMADDYQPEDGDEPKKKKAKEKKIFDVKLIKTDSDRIYKHVDKLYRKTNQRMHASSSLNIKTIYEVEIKHMADGFKKDGDKLDNVWELWHGTRSSNLLSILKGGFIIPPINSGHCTGRMFGNGVYFSDQSTKSLNYAYGYWGGNYDRNCFMFLCNVAMGNYIVPRGNTGSNPPKGYDSYYAKGNQSGVMNNEMIVFRTSQINPKYLIEFS